MNHRLRFLAAMTIVCACACGCQLWQTESLSPAAQVEAAIGDSQTLNELTAKLSRDSWQMNRSWTPVSAAFDVKAVRPPESALHWHIGDVACDDSDLEQLSGRDDLVGWNAAILWGHREPSKSGSIAPVLERLCTKPPSYEREESGKNGDQKSEEKDSKEGVAAADKKPLKRRVRISSRMQSAAAESLCLVLSAQSDDPIEGLASVGRLLERSNLDDAIRAELYRGVARFVPPNDVPQLANAFSQSSDKIVASVEIRRAAIECCLIYALTHRSAVDDGSNNREFNAESWPDAIMSCRVDGDFAVRESFGRWLAAVRHPQAFEILKKQSVDSDQRVRETALVSLGMLKSDEARNELRDQAKSTKELVRAVALEGLGNWGVAELKTFADDSSVHVRKALARELGRHPQVESALILRDLFLDANPQVQAAAVDAVDSWSNDLAIPLLLQSISESSFATRRLSVQQFVRRTGLKEDFPFDAAPDVRAEAVAKIAHEHNLPLGYFETIRKKAPASLQQSDESHVAGIRADLVVLTSNQPRSPEYVAAIDRLTHLGSNDVSVIEAWLTTVASPQRSEVYREVLPRLSPVYQSLEEMKHADVAIRRRGASRLAQLGADVSLSAHAVGILHERLAEEQDNLVWRYAMLSVFKDGTDEVAHIACLAINHTWPDIREQGCLYIAQHGQPQHAPWLTSLLNDSNRAVQLAAIRAAGRCRNPIVLDGPRQKMEPGKAAGLRGLLIHPDRQIRFETTVAMSRLGDEQGMQELVRLSADQNAAVRESVVKEMGESGQTRFVDHLVRLGWTETNDRVQRAVLASLELLTPPEKRPPGLVQESRNDVKIELWNNWQQQQNRQGIQQWSKDTKTSSSNGTATRL